MVNGPRHCTEIPVWIPWSFRRYNRLKKFHVIKMFFFLGYSVGNSVGFHRFFDSELMNKWKFLISIETQLIQWFGMISEESRGHVIFMIYFHLLYWCSSSNPCVIIIILISNYHLNDYVSIFFLYIKRLWLPFKSEEIE
jgi:hypothetical protein